MTVDPRTRVRSGHQGLRSVFFPVHLNLDEEMSQEGRRLSLALIFSLTSCKYFL